MYRIQTLNEISGVINQVFNSDYEIGKDVSQPDAIIVRSAKMHDMELPDTLTAVAPSSIRSTTPPAIRARPPVPGCACCTPTCPTWSAQ